MSKTLKRILISFLILAGVYVGLRLYLNRILKEVIIEQVAQFEDKNYSLELGSVDIGWWAFNANLQGLKLKKVMNTRSMNDQFHFSLSASKVKLKGLYLFELLFHQKLQLRKLLIVDPTITIDYNDTIPKESRQDSSLVQVYYKLSSIILQNANIAVNKTSGEKFRFKSKLVDYNLENVMLQLQRIEFEQINSLKQNFDYTCKISHASLKGFDLNAMINEMNFNYSDCAIDTLDIKLQAHDELKLLVKKDTTWLQKIKTVSSRPLNPLSITHIKFDYQSKSDKISLSAMFFKYYKHRLNLERIKLSVKQQHLIVSAVDKISIQGFDVDKFLAFKHASVSNIKFQNPSVKYTINVQEDYIQLLKIPDQKIGYRIDFIQNIEINNGSIALDHHHQPHLKLAVKGIQVHAKGVDPHYFDEPMNMNLLQGLTMNTGAASLNFSSNLYHFNVASIAYDLGKENLQIQEIDIRSNYNKKAFFAAVKKQIAMITLQLKSLTATHLNLNTLINTQRFECDLIDAKQLEVRFYKDKNIPLLAQDIKKFPQQLLHELNYPILIAKVNVQEASLISEILNPGAGSSAQLKVSEVKATVTHVDNKKYKGNFMTVNFEGKIAGEGLLKATAVLDMFAADYKHTVHAEVGRMPFKYLNDFMFDFAGVEINSGTLDKAVIDIKGNAYKLRCKLDLSYHDLTMDILRNQNKKHKRYRNIASILANAIIYNNNPEPGKQLRKSIVEQDYISNKFVVGNWINVSLKAMLLTTAPTAANALQINNSTHEGDTTMQERSPNWLKRIIERKQKK